MPKNAAVYLILVALAAGAVGYLVGTSDGETPSHSAGDDRTTPSAADTSAGADGQTEGEVLYWRAPMDPTEIYDEPGQSRMGMELIPVYADDLEESSGAVRVDPAIIQSMGVRTTAVERRDLSRQIRTVGEVMYDEDRLVGINARVAGWVERLHVTFVGDQVAAGDPLLDIYSPELVTTQEEYLLARRHLASLAEDASVEARRDAERLLSATRSRLQNWNVPETLIADLDRTDSAHRVVTLTAPTNGVVVWKNVVEGDHIRSGSELFRIADLTSVWVHASFYDHEVPWLAEGQPATMELSYLPGEVYEGRIEYIYPYLREKARDVHVRLVFPNEDLALKPGMYTNVQLDGLTRRDVLTVPSAAVIRSGEEPLVFVDLKDGRYEPRTVRIGAQGGPGNNLVHIISGLREGERVVTSAQFMLDSESRLQEVIEKMMPRSDDGFGDGAAEHDGHEPASDSNSAPMLNSGADSVEHDQTPSDSSTD